MSDDVVCSCKSCREARAAVRARFVKVPVRWCTVHESAFIAAPGGRCLLWIYTSEAGDQPCRLVPCFINPTENPPSA